MLTAQRWTSSGKPRRKQPERPRTLQREAKSARSQYCVHELSGEQTGTEAGPVPTNGLAALSHGPAVPADRCPRTAVSDLRVDCRILTPTLMLVSFAPTRRSCACLIRTT